MHVKISHGSRWSLLHLNFGIYVHELRIPLTRNPFKLKRCNYSSIHMCIVWQLCFPQAMYNTTKDAYAPPALGLHIFYVELYWNMSSRHILGNRWLFTDTSAFMVYISCCLCHYCRNSLVLMDHYVVPVLTGIRFGCTQRVWLSPII